MYCIVRGSVGGCRNKLYFKTIDVYRTLYSTIGWKYLAFFSIFENTVDSTLLD